MSKERHMTYAKPAVQRIQDRLLTAPSRRAVLRGAIGGLAVSLALPSLEALLPSERAQARAQGAELPPFFGLFFWANGTPWHAVHGAQQAQAGHPDLWTPAQTGAGYTPSELLSPLSRHQVSVISGLTPHTDIPSSPAGQGDGHMRGFMVSLTGDRPQPEGFDHSSHTLTALRPTLDQYVARHPGFYQAHTPAFRSLEVGVSEARFHTYGHWNAISYNGPNSLNLPTMSPTQLYDRLFSVPTDDGESTVRAQVISAVHEEASRLRGLLGSADQQRLEAHLEHLLTLQGRLEADAQRCEAPARPLDQGDLIQRAEVMGELLALAVTCDLTRCFSMMLTSPATTHLFSNLGVPDGMHKTCHDGHWERVRNITRYQMEALAAFLDAFSRTEASGAPLLDRGLIYATSEYGEGWKHSVAELPVLLAGRARGALQQGVHVRSPGGNLAVAQLSALRALGLSDEQFGWNGAQTSDTFGALFS